MPESFLIDHAGSVRLGVFVGILVAMSALEALAPRRARRRSREKRWPLHLGLAAAGGLVGRILAPVGAVAAAAYSESQGLGLFTRLDWPVWIEWTLTVLLFDLAVYGQHVLSHHWRWLWRLHRLHHQDVDLDATSGVRFHPVEIGLSTLWKAVVALALGPSVGAVVLFEIVLNGTALFNHANLRLPLALDRVLRLVLVTPDMHRVHHSVDPEESRRNYGFAVVAWDHLFRTYQAQPAAGQQGMTLGVDERSA
ncbi:sterol desaturase family protein [Saltatorellus ferox]|uniref:sterol desaturase family protein n=1 Tax=Saltatorellus ferox TaxID=2528018 RepID=UPI003AF34B8F